MQESDSGRDMSRMKLNTMQKIAVCGVKSGLVTGE